MAGEKISAMSASSDGFNKQDLVEVSEWNGSGFVTKKKDFLQILMGLLPGGIVYVDAINGNDGDAIGSPFLPFQTISAAEAVYGGANFYIRQGNYAEGSIGTDGATYFCENGMNNTFAGSMWTNPSSDSYRVYGYGYFVTTTGHVIHASQPSLIEVNCAYAISTGNGSRVVYAQDADCTVLLNATRDVTHTGDDATVRVDGANAQVFVTANRIIGYGAIIGTSGAANAKVVLRADEHRYEAAGIGYIGINIDGGAIEMYGKVFLNGNGLYSLQAIHVHGSGSLKIYGDGESTSGDGTAVMSGSGSMEIYGNWNSTGIIALSAGKTRLEGTFINNLANQQVVRMSGTGKLLNNALIKNIDANAGSSAVGLSSGTPELVSLQNARYIVDAAATYSIDSTPTLNIKSYPGAVANKAIQVGTITELVSTILIDANVDSE